MDRCRAVLGIGRRTHFSSQDPVTAWSQWQEYLLRTARRTMGHLSYELCHGMESIGIHRPSPEQFPLLHWFEPELLLEEEDGITTIHGDRARMERLAGDLSSSVGTRPARSGPPDAEWRVRTSRAAYLKIAHGLMDHIRRGDIYEVNYCIERTAELPGWDPIRAFQDLLCSTEAPFAGCYRHGDTFVLCASPERFLEIEGDRIRTEPMKGTRPRDVDVARDQALADELRTDPKERSENIMATDVARHDLGRVARTGSVEVTELCGVRAFRNVHQMVSRVEALLRDDQHITDAVRASWPMASMTGAPKVRAMQLINEAEGRPRGVFSGSIGWVEGDRLDLNVVIRTIVHNAVTGHTSLITGSALTAACDPEQEWEECELKARSVLRAIGHGN
ncbi:MAG: anthranilate synthase component I family protein [Flavobacteriales bacterium]|nr:anthranilate synthase component I family protein [Flavobacteriales bacterium]MCB9193294.1 anthranilate synthase component I family protein [Flavobacteriales bacterium]